MRIQTTENRNQYQQKRFKCTTTTTKIIKTSGSSQTKQIWYSLGSTQAKQDDYHSVVKQHYTNYKSFYWRWIPAKVRYLKTYKAEMLQDLLAQSKMWWPNIIAWNNNTLSSEYLNNPGEVGIRQFSWDIQNIRTFQYSPDIQKYASILTLLDELVVQDTWENLKATYQAVAPQLRTVEIIENARATRLASVDENDDLFLTQILTCSLDNITQYAPKLQTKP